MHPLSENTTFSGAPGHSLGLDLRNVTTSFRLITPFFSLEFMHLFYILNFFVFNIPLSALGMSTNFANIIVYFKMGFTESSNMNFFALAVFDFIFSLISVVGALFINPLISHLSIAPLLGHIGQGLGRAVFFCNSGSAMLTAMISAERCFCVVFPLKVKTWLSFRRRLGLLLTIIAYNLTFLILLYVDTGPPYNEPSQKLSFYYLFMYITPLHVCFFIVILNTLFLVQRLRVTQHWRKKTATQSTKNEDKENRLAKTVIAISTLFIIGAFPVVALFFTEVFYPRFNYVDPYFYTLSFVVYSVSVHPTQLSSAVNIIFYYKLSSRFKKVFSTCFLLKMTKMRGSNGVKSRS